jgi:hypothetical protein
MQREEKGPRSNGVLEGITYKAPTLARYTNVEELCNEDGSQATTTKGG